MAPASSICEEKQLWRRLLAPVSIKTSKVRAATRSRKRESPYKDPLRSRQCLVKYMCDSRASKMGMGKGVIRFFSI